LYIILIVKKFYMQL